MPFEVFNYKWPWDATSATMNSDKIYTTTLEIFMLINSFLKFKLIIEI